MPRNSPQRADPFEPKQGYLLVALLVLTILSYLPALDAGFIWDDDDYVTKNVNLRSWSGLVDIWTRPASTPQYYPLVFTTFWLDYHCWGLNPAGYHAVNILLHLVTALLIWQTLVYLRVPGAWFAAALFAVHPVQVESVAWITERKNVLSALFYWSAMLAYFRFSPVEPGEPVLHSRRWYFLSLFLFVCALLSKSVTCSLPAVILLIIWWKQSWITRRDCLALLPFFLIGLVLGLHTAWLEKVHVGAEGAEWHLSFLDRVLLAGRAIWFYLGSLIWPYQLTFIYPRWEINASEPWQYVYPLLVLLLFAGLWFARHRIGRGPVVAFLCFVGTLFPALGFFDVYPFRYSFVADHFQYHACIFFFAAFAAAGTMLLSHFRASSRFQQVAGGVILLGLGALTCWQCLPYESSETLWLDTLRKNPTCWMAYNNLGVSFMAHDHCSEAHACFAKALEYAPNNREVKGNVGTALTRLKRYAEAERLFISTLNDHPNDGALLCGLGIVYLEQGKLSQAEQTLRQAFALTPSSLEKLTELGSTLLRQRRGPEAVKLYRVATLLTPDEPVVWFKLSLALQLVGARAEARDALHQATQIAERSGSSQLARQFVAQFSKQSQ